MLNREYTTVGNVEIVALCRLIEIHNFPIKKAALATGIRYENAKRIHRIYKEENRLMKYENCRTRDGEYEKVNKST